MPAEIAPDPSRIGVIADPPFAIPPDPAALFARRATRLAFLAKSSRLGPYLSFLSELAGTQAKLAAALPAPAPLPAEQVARARAAGLPPIEGAALARSGDLATTISAFLDAAGAIPKPEPARAALDLARAAGRGEWERMALNLIAATVPAEEAAVHLYVAAGLQIHAARLAATLDAKRLVPVGTGACPCCGGRPAVSLVMALPKVEGVRYAACATCQTLWNEVRVKCLACGSTKGIGYRSLDAEGSVIKAEVCDSCHSWVKTLYQTKDAGLEQIADDVASLGLDALMGGTDWRRAGFDPFLIGY
ncbi:formate dehydrogenase accessory protein FdhE [Amaricoccus solimangrovi]|uniref:Protein FdhE homolog n=1 Tax=Amaricoccus solimangrovi TaxID=2589815 RepID=A0A501WKI3_9RHOB|nr:formate dehydrogenase accessory protein FdhE [Amaricoccus solimangrovi]TPE47561.1 formate dehydrogenase accessory protein FdhE [Amaricoccus solimangrovi]